MLSPHSNRRFIIDTVTPSDGSAGYTITKNSTLLRSNSEPNYTIEYIHLPAGRECDQVQSSSVKPVHQPVSQSRSFLGNQSLKPTGTDTVHEDETTPIFQKCVVKLTSYAEGSYSGVTVNEDGQPSEQPSAEVMDETLTLEELKSIYDSAYDGPGESGNFNTLREKRTYHTAILPAAEDRADVTLTNRKSRSRRRKEMKNKENLQLQQSNTQVTHYVNQV